LKCAKVRHDVIYNAETLKQITDQLEARGFRIQPYLVDVEGYREYVKAADYASHNYYQDHLSYNFPEKSLEHYVAADMLDLQPDETYVDIGNDGSPVPEIYHRLYGVSAWRQDLIYEKGLHLNTIGGDAAEMPVCDEFAGKMALHCTFEHFEGDSDSRFIRECHRVLKPGGRVCILPLYLHTEYAIQTDLSCVEPDEVPFEDQAVHYCQFGYNNRHGRFYDSENLVSRIANQMENLRLKLFLVENAHDVDSSCYLKYMALIEKQPG
jgi:SAM-dependent methyltransferase